ncbi:hypothetical protein ISS37_06520 [candidate division KSB1 bacterium]|nr:hypothetical protein [candidate division KSB1 bacterium]
MKTISWIAIVAAAISFILGFIAVFAGDIVVRPGAYLNFTNTCLLVAVVFLVMEIAGAKKE